MRGKKIGVTVFVVVMIVLLSACGGGKTNQIQQSDNESPTQVDNEVNQVDDTPTPSQKEDQPNENADEAELLFTMPDEDVTLRVMMSLGHGTIDRLNLEGNDSDQAFLEQYPNVSLEYYSTLQWDELMAIGVIPDVINIVYANIDRLIETGVNYDMTDIVKASDVDFSRFDQSILDLIRLNSGDGSLVGLPDKIDFPYTAFGLAYNKEIFDTFALSYPEDGMTWSEVIELARRLNRDSDYYPLHVCNAAQVMRNQLELSLMDDSGKIDFSDPGWQKIFNTIKAIGDAQHDKRVLQCDAKFVNERNVAMMAGRINGIIVNNLDLSGLDWDIVTLPTFEGVDLKVPISGGVYSITKQSENKAAAMAYINYIYENSSYLQQWEADGNKDRNLAALTNKDVAQVPLTKYDGNLTNILDSRLSNMVNSGTDINTAIRESEEMLQIELDLLLK